jgi:hypothetical protein
MLREWLAAHAVAGIGEVEWRGLLRELAPVSESYLRQLLRDTGMPFAQPYSGIHQKSFAELERTLREMLEVYTEAVRAGDREKMRECRRQVIAAKDRARILGRRTKASDDERVLKEEMAQWMLVWLENPEVFPAWVEIRKRHIG